jgi:RNA polymerase sigma factor (TIGR02999 family)
MADVTQILTAIERGDPHAAAELLPLVYDELRKLAAARLADEKPGQTLQATALVHEAYVRLVGGRQSDGWNSRGHFFGAAAEAMRRILVENARRKLRIKHGGATEQVELEVAELTTTVPDDDLLALDEALAQLKQEDPDKARLIELRFFGGLSNEQAADILGISTATAKRHWRYARAWLHRSLRPDDEAPSA